MAGNCFKALGDAHMEEISFDGAIQLLSENEETGILARADLADMYISQERYEEAEPLLRQVLELRRNHPSVVDWLMGLAICVVDGREEPSQEEVDEAISLLDEAYTLLISKGKEKLVTNSPRERVILQCVTTRAIAKSKSDDWSVRHAAIEDFKVADEIAQDSGPSIGRMDLVPIYAGWAEALQAVDLPEEAERVLEYGEKQLAKDLSR